MPKASRRKKQYMYGLLDGSGLASGTFSSWFESGLESRIAVFLWNPHDS